MAANFEWLPASGEASAESPDFDHRFDPEKGAGLVELGIPLR